MEETLTVLHVDVRVAPAAASQVHSIIHRQGVLRTSTVETAHEKEVVRLCDSPEPREQDCSTRETSYTLNRHTTLVNVRPTMTARHHGGVRGTHLWLAFATKNNRGICLSSYEHASVRRHHPAQPSTRRKKSTPAQTSVSVRRRVLATGSAQQEEAKTSSAFLPSSHPHHVPR